MLSRKTLFHISRACFWGFVQQLLWMEKRRLHEVQKIDMQFLGSHLNHISDPVRLTYYGVVNLIN